jgi:peptide/nickel transport system substrate-binding protein
VKTQKGNTVRERTAAMLQQQLREVGLTVDVVAFERNAVIGQFMTGDYEAGLFGVEFDSFDPARNLQFWLSSGGFHVWHPGQASPATPWEKRIDELMTQQAATLDPAERRRLFAEVQREFNAHMPVLYFAAPRTFIATSTRLQGAIPSVLAPPVLWNAERLSVAAPADAARR